MRNKMPKAIGNLTAFGRQAFEALIKLEDQFVLLYNTPDLIRQDVRAVDEANAVYQTAKAVRMAATDAQQLAAEKAVTFITLARDWLKPSFGTRYSQLWNQTGFFHCTLSLPTTMAGQSVLLQSLQIFLSEHPEKEVAGVLTAQIAGELFETFTASMHAVNAAWSAQRQQKALRDAAVAELTARMRKVYRELKEFLSNTDPRWLLLGFKVPGDTSTAKANEEAVVEAPVSQDAATQNMAIPEPAKVKCGLKDAKSQPSAPCEMPISQMTVNTTAPVMNPSGGTAKEPMVASTDAPIDPERALTG